MIRSEVSANPRIRRIRQELEPPQPDSADLDMDLLRAVIDARISGYASFVSGLPTADYGEFLYVGFRSLTLDEFDVFSNVAQLTREENLAQLVVEHALLWPPRENYGDLFDRLLPGAVDGLYRTIVDCSGFENVNAWRAAQQMGRQQAVKTIFPLAHTFIMRAMPGMSIGDFKNMDLVQLFKYVALAEGMLSTNENKVEFPLAQLLSGPKKPKRSRLPDFEHLPVFSEAELQGMRASADLEYGRSVYRRAKIGKAVKQEEILAHREEMQRRRRKNLGLDREDDEKLKAEMQKTYGMPKGFG